MEKNNQHLKSSFLQTSGAHKKLEEEGNIKMILLPN